jgi:hypothetical protein
MGTDSGMNQFAPGTLYVPGSEGNGPDGSGQRTLQPLTRVVQQAMNYTRKSDGIDGQVALFQAVNGSASLYYARVDGVTLSSAYLYVGQGNSDNLVDVQYLVATTDSGIADEASWARGIPVYPQWSMAVFWTRPIAYGIGTAHLYYQEYA